MRTKAKFLFFALSLGLLMSNFALGQRVPKLRVDVSADNHPIDPNIYGIAGFGIDSAFAQEIKLPNARWGGDDTTRYNWQVDSSNSGGDFFFIGGTGVSTPTPSGQVDAMINTYKPAGTNPLITIPIIPYINSTSQYTCSFNQTNYPDQGLDPAIGWTIFFPYITTADGLCGMGFDVNIFQMLDTNIYYNHIDNEPSIQQAWVKHLVGTFGKGWKGGGIHYFQLDNEPGGWGNTHLDIMPNGAQYDTIVALGEQYASAVKKVDPSALILGPSDFTLGGWIGDTNQQNGLYAGQYYLQQMNSYEKQNGKRILDYFDEHYYGPNPGDDASELEATRALWDPTFNSGTWVEQYVFDGPMKLIPRFKSWINKYYPGTKLAITEYNLGHDGEFIGALALTDGLGIFGREGLNYADIFTVPDPTAPDAYAFRIYRNYDGQGGQYGDTWVSSKSSDQSQLAIYGALRSKDKALTLVIINKNTTDITTQVALSNFDHPNPVAQFYNYSNTNPTAIVQGADIPIDQTGYSATGFRATFPARSASVVVISREK
jgi:Glycoside hydrolase family 44